MLKTDWFEMKHLESCYSLQNFLNSKNITITIRSDYKPASKWDMQPTEFIFIEYPEEIELLIEYWINSNNIKFYS